MSSLVALKIEVIKSQEQSFCGKQFFLSLFFLVEELSKQIQALEQEVEKYARDRCLL